MFLFTAGFHHRKVLVGVRLSAQLPRIPFVSAAVLVMSTTPYVECLVRLIGSSPLTKIASILYLSENLVWPLGRISCCLLFDSVSWEDKWRNRNI